MSFSGRDSLIHGFIHSGALIGVTNSNNLHGLKRVNEVEVWGCVLTVYTADPQSSENLGDASVTAGETETDEFYNPAGPDDQPVNTRRMCLSLSTDTFFFLIKQIMHK